MSRLLDASGSHWEPHGLGVHHAPQGDPAAPRGAGVDVYSYFNNTGSTPSVAPAVVLVGGMTSATGAVHLTPDAARAFAASLLAAAERAEAVAALIAQRAARKAPARV